MAKIPQTGLFQWTQIDAASDVDRLRLVLEALPDEPLVRLLEQRRDRGRDDYPIRPTWNALMREVRPSAGRGFPVFVVPWWRQ